MHPILKEVSFVNVTTLSKTTTLDRLMDTMQSAATSMHTAYAACRPQPLQVWVFAHVRADTSSDQQSQHYTQLERHTACIDLCCRMSCDTGHVPTDHFAKAIQDTTVLHSARCACHHNITAYHDAPSIVDRCQQQHMSHAIALFCANVNAA